MRILPDYRIPGPIIRINPEELHIDDPDYYDELYGSASRKRDKYGLWVALVGSLGSSFATVGHIHHRMRRAALKPCFSKAEVTKLEPLIQRKVDKLAARFEKAMRTGEIIITDAAYTALTTDVICQYAFAADDNFLDEDDFKLAWGEALIGATEGGALLRQFPWMFPLMNALPESLLGVLQPSLKLMLDWRAGVRQRALPILEGIKAPEDIETSSHRTIFHELRDSDLPEHEKTIDRLCDEGQILVGAGSGTTAQTLAVITFYLLENRQLLTKLKDELKTIMPNPRLAVSWKVLDKLPFLSAVISEGLRISIGMTTRLPRVATDESLRYKEWEIPFRTPVSETNYFVLMNPVIFPQPSSFVLERWIKDSGYNCALDKYLVTFGKGTRQCLGINLAYAELYLTIATIFRRFEMALFKTTLDDVAMVHDFFTPVPRLDSKGIRVKVIGECKA